MGVGHLTTDIKPGNQACSEEAEDGDEYEEPEEADGNGGTGYVLMLRAAAQLMTHTDQNLQMFSAWPLRWKCI